MEVDCEFWVALRLRYAVRASTLVLMRRLMMIPSWNSQPGGLGARPWALRMTDRRAVKWP